MGLASGIQEIDEHWTLNDYLDANEYMLLEDEAEKYFAEKNKPAKG